MRRLLPIFPFPPSSDPCAVLGEDRNFMRLLLPKFRPFSGLQRSVRRVGTFAITALLVLIFDLCALSSPLLTLASTDPIDSSPPVSATVPAQAVADDTTPPTSPILIRPTDGSATGDSTPEFVWRQSTDPNSNTIHYTFYLNNVATYLGVSNDGSSASSGPPAEAGYTATIDSTEVRLIPTTALPDGVYSWKVVAYDQAGNQAFSTSWNLTIDTLAPFLTLTKLDNIDNPIITEESSFEIAGPKAVSFVILTEPYASVRLTLTHCNPSSAPCSHSSDLHTDRNFCPSPLPSSAPCSHSSDLHTDRNFTDSEPLSLTISTNHTGEATFAPHLATGLYYVSISATDHVNLVSVLPTFTLKISTTSSPLVALTATIAKVTPKPLIMFLIIFILLILFILIIILRRRRPNLILLDPLGNPINDALITHSRPPVPNLPLVRNFCAPSPSSDPSAVCRSSQAIVRRVGTSATSASYHPHSPSLFSILPRSPRSHTLYSIHYTGSPVHIPHLSRYSTLTIRTQHPTSCTITVLSLSVKRPSYTIVL